MAKTKETLRSARWFAPDDLRGDLHVHTSYSGDGRSSLEDIVAQLLG